MTHNMTMAMSITMFSAPVLLCRRTAVLLRFISHLYVYGGLKHRSWELNLIWQWDDDAHCTVASIAY